MKRLGKLTGNVYDDSFESVLSDECCSVITNKQAADEDFKSMLKAINLKRCMSCMKCPEAKKHAFDQEAKICM